MTHLQNILDTARELAWPHNASLPHKLVKASLATLFTTTALAYISVTAIASYKAVECISTGYEDQEGCAAAREILDGQSAVVPIIGTP